MVSDRRSEQVVPLSRCRTPTSRGGNDGSRNVPETIYKRVEQRPGKSEDSHRRRSKTWREAPGNRLNYCVKLGVIDHGFEQVLQGSFGIGAEPCMYRRGLDNRA